MTLRMMEGTAKAVDLDDLLARHVLDQQHNATDEVVVDDGLPDFLSPKKQHSTKSRSKSSTTYVDLAIG